jgi:hypothetical protein
MTCSDNIKKEIILIGDYVTYVDHKYVVYNVNYTIEQRNILIRKIKLNEIFGDGLQ